MGATWAKRHPWLEVKWDEVVGRFVELEGGRSHSRGRTTVDLTESTGSEEPLFLPDPDEEEKRRKRRKTEEKKEESGELLRGKGKGKEVRKEEKEEEEADEGEEEEEEEGLPSTLAEWLKRDAVTALSDRERGRPISRMVDVLAVLAKEKKKESEAAMEELWAVFAKARKAQEELGLLKGLMEYWGGEGDWDIRDVEKVMCELERGQEKEKEKEEEKTKKWNYRLV